MTQQTTSSAPRPAAPPAPRSPDNSRWTGAKASAFLRALAEHGKVARAARSVGMSRQAAYRLKARAPAFAEYWGHAMQVAQDRRAASARKRRKPVHPLLQRAPRDASGDTGGQSR